MKTLNLFAVLVLLLGRSAVAAPDAIFVNNALMTTRTNIDARVFINPNTIFFDGLALNTVDGTLFQTQDTLYLTNTGTMFSQPGFSFSDHTATGNHPSAFFYNPGTIIGLDAPAVAFLANGEIPIVVPSQPPGTGGAGLLNGAAIPFLSPFAGAGTNTSVPSAIVVSATNIVSPGLIEAGALGKVQLSGANIDLSGGSVAVGAISETDTNATTGRGVSMGYNVGAVMEPFYSPPAGVYDICWAVDNGSSYNQDVLFLYDSLSFLSEGLDEIDTPGFPIIGVGGTGGSRNGTIEGYSLVNYWNSPGAIFPINSPLAFAGLTTNTSTPTTVPPAWTSYAYYYGIIFGTGPYTTNWYYNVIYLNSAFADTNMTAQVAFYGQNLLGIEQLPGYGGLNTVTNGNPYALEGMIRFSAPVTDVITGQTVSNSVYFLDTSAIQVPACYATNSDYPTFAYARPLGFEITRNEPVEWQNQIPGNVFLFDPTVLDLYVRSNTVPMTNSFYVAQVGLNPEAPDGLDPYTALLLGHSQTGMPNLTNQPGGIQINASKTNNVSNMKLRATGFVTMNASNVVGTPGAVSYGNYSLDLGNLKSPLLISNLIPAKFNQIRGDIAAYSADFMNVITNDGITTNRITNNVLFHVVIVDQDLRSTFAPTGSQVKLHGSNVVVDDPLRVAGSVYFEATNLVFNSNVVLTGTAGALQTPNLPTTKNLTIGAGASLLVDNYINVGMPLNALPVNPTKLNTPFLSITNLGTIGSGQIDLQSQWFANDGTLVTSNYGLIAISAITNLLGLGRTGLPNTLASSGSVNLTSTSIQLTNAIIMAGLEGNGQLTINATGELTDHYPGTPSTRSYTTNIIQVTSGFSLLSKPASGDLFATQITTLASNANQTIVHVWAGEDRGPTRAGFINNAVVGHLILDRTTNATLRFSAAGKSNALYVDYLDLRDLAFSDYHNGLVVDTNFTIYFANCNVDPAKLQRVSGNRIVWVPEFTGPNSTADVRVTTPYGHYSVPMNAALANSSGIDTDEDGAPNLNDPYPLNNPALGPWPMPSPTLVTSNQTISVANGSGTETLVLFTTGQGRISNNISAAHGLTGGPTVKLTAVPANNWFFQNWSSGQGTNGFTNPTNFVVPTNLAFSWLTANFVTNPFFPLAGVYNGLFSVPGAVNGNNSGFVTFTLSTSGVFSGKLRIGATTNYSFSSQFSLGGTATTGATNGTNVLYVTLRVGQSAQSDQATGSVTNARFSASLTAYHVPAWTTVQPAPQAGSYTLVFPGNANAAANPGGDSYGTATVDALGNLTALGTLANNVQFSQVVPVSKGGQWPLYFTPAGVPEALLGWVAFDTNGAGGRPAELGGTVTWVKAAGAGSYYTNAFTNSAFLLGSSYSAAYQRTNGLALNNPSVTLSGGNLVASVLNWVNAGGLETYQTADGKTVTLTINAATGGVTGQYVAPGTSRRVPLAGVVLQNQDEARGFFLGTNQSGAWLLQGN